MLLKCYTDGVVDTLYCQACNSTAAVDAPDETAAEEPVVPVKKPAKPKATEAELTQLALEKAARGEVLWT